MSTKATLWYNEEWDTHLYRDMADNSYWLETPWYKIFILHELGACLDSVIIPNKPKKGRITTSHMNQCPICKENYNKEIRNKADNKRRTKKHKKK
jgi:hypothetical protein